MFVVIGEEVEVVTWYLRPHSAKSNMDEGRWQIGCYVKLSRAVLPFIWKCIFCSTLMTLILT